MRVLIGSLLSLKSNLYSTPELSQRYANGKNMDKVDRLSTPSPTRLIVKCIIGLFAAITVTLVILAVIVILTQKPVDLSHVVVASQTPYVEEQKSTSKTYRKYGTTTEVPQYRKFTFDDLFSGKIFLKDSYTLAWNKDNQLLKNRDEFFADETGTTAIDGRTFEEKLFLDNSEAQQTLSSNEKYAYIADSIRQGFRHSRESIYRIHKVSNGKVLNISFPVGPKGTGNEFVSLLKWNPNKQKNNFVFVADFNMYYQDDPEKAGSAVQISDDGDALLRYGIADWLYEEEIFQSNEAVWWSDTGRYISYMRSDDRSVNKVFIPRYLTSSPYTQYLEIPYPKSGVENNPTVILFIWDREQNKAVIAFPPAEFQNNNQSHYVYSNTWMKMPENRKELGTERLVTIWSNREQNQIYITLCNEVDCILTYSQAFVINGRSMWAEPYDLKSVVPSKTGFFVLLPHAHSDGNIYNHVAHIEIEPAGTGRVSSWHGGSYDVKQLKGYIASEDVLTFVSAGGGIGTQKLFRITNASSEKGVIHPISSYIPSCEYGTYEVSPDGRTAGLSCSMMFKNTRLWIMDVLQPERHKLLDGGEDYPLPFDTPTVSFESLRLSSGYDAHIGIMKPPNFDVNKKYPVLIDVYGGPNSNRVKRSTPGPNLIHYCSYYNIIILWIDARGTGNRGWNIKSPVYKTLGQFESMDTLDAVKQLSSKYTFFDQKNIAIFGWSYGGFLSTRLSMIDQGRTVKCAIAVAPVTDMALYDSAYTERYMGLPLENLSGYNNSKLTAKAGDLRNVQYLLAHGGADDNVHYQHSALLSEALQGKLIHFTQIVYSNQDHSLSGRQRHLFKEIGIFISDCFGLNLS